MWQKHKRELGGNVTVTTSNKRVQVKRLAMLQERIEKLALHLAVFPTDATVATGDLPTRFGQHGSWSMRAERASAVSGVTESSVRQSAEGQIAHRADRH